MKWKLEFSMYLMFSLAALPFAWVAVDLLIYYGSSPEILQERETHRDAAIIFAILPFAMITLIPASLSAVYLLLSGRSSERVALLALVSFYIIIFWLPLPRPPVNTLENLAWEVATNLLLAAVPSLFLAIRFRQYRTTTLQSHSPADQKG